MGAVYLHVILYLLMLSRNIMRDTELRQERDRSVYETYLRGLREQHFTNMHEVADWVRSQPAPKFYLSSKSLVNYLGAIKAGKKLRLHQSTKDKVDHLKKMYDEFLSNNPGCRLSRERICEILVDEPAPRYYLGHNYTLMILQKERAKALEEIRRRYTI